MKTNIEDSSMKRKSTMNRIIFLILLTVAIVSCRSVVIRNLTGRIVLDEIKESNDTVDFYIKEIKLINVESLKACDFWGEGSPRFNLEINITNKLNESIYLIPSDWSEVYFVGIFSPELNVKKDTIDFVNFFDKFPNLLEPESSVVFVVSSIYINPDRFFDSTQLDNTEPMLDLVRQMKFYYAPLSTNKKNIGQDTIVIDNLSFGYPISSHRLNIYSIDFSSALILKVGKLQIQKMV